MQSAYLNIRQSSDGQIRLNFRTTDSIYFQLLSFLASQLLSVSFFSVALFLGQLLSLLTVDQFLSQSIAYFTYSCTVSWSIAQFTCSCSVS